MKAKKVNGDIKLFANAQLFEQLNVVGKRKSRSQPRKLGFDI
jgi:hypothetical protein